MGYELFHNKSARLGSPGLTIRSGKLALNADAGDVLARAGARYAHLLWDAEARKLAIKPRGKEDGNTFRISIPEGKRGGTITASSFLKFIGWKARKPVVVDARWSATEGILEAFLPKEYVSDRQAEGYEGLKLDVGSIGIPMVREDPEKVAEVYQETTKDVTANRTLKESRNRRRLT